MESIEKRFGIKPGEQVPLHIANQIQREQRERSRNAAKQASEAAAEAVGAVLDSEGHEKPRSGRRTQKNLRPVSGQEKSE